MGLAVCVPLFAASSAMAAAAEFHFSAASGEANAVTISEVANPEPFRATSLVVTDAGTAPPAPNAPSFRAAIVGTDVVVEGGRYLRVVELPEDGLLVQPGSDMDWPPKPNPGAPSTPRAALIAGRCAGTTDPVFGQCPGGRPEAGEPGGGCQTVPQLPGVLGFSVLCPLQPGGTVRVRLSGEEDRLRVDGGEHPEGHGFHDVFNVLTAPLDVSGGAGNDRFDVATDGSVRVDGEQGDDRFSIAWSRPASLIGGSGDDQFSSEEVVTGRRPRTHPVSLDCGPGADFVRPHPLFRHGRGCPAEPPRLAARPLTVRGTCRERCRWQGPRRIVVNVKNPTSQSVSLRSVRLAIAHWNNESGETRRVTLARRDRLVLPARGATTIPVSGSKGRALYRQLGQHITLFGVVPPLELTGSLLEHDGDRTMAEVDVRIRERGIKGNWSVD